MPNQPTSGRRTRSKGGNEQAAERVFERDFDKVRPGKVVPGVVGRSRWFAERSGDHEQSLSLERLRRGLAHAEGLLDAASLRAEALEEARSLLDAKSESARKRLLQKPSLVEASGRSSAVAEVGGRRRDGLTALGPPVEVKGEGLLVFPVDERAATELDLEAPIVADVSEPLEPVLNESFGYLAQERVVAGRIRRAGRYQLFALPKDPQLRATFDAVARHWTWAERDPAVREAAGGRSAAARRGLLERIGRVILTGAESDDGKRGSRGGSKPSPELAALTARIGELLGDLEVAGGRIVRPPLIKWWWDVFPRCSRWFSIGPFPDSSFRGIGRVSQIACHPSNGNVLIAAAAGGGVWRTVNGGGSWVPCMELQPTLTMGAVAIAPSNPSIMYAASGEDGGGWNPAWSGVGVYRSGDGGGTWTLMAPVPSTRFSAIVVHPRYPNVVYVAGNRGLHKSRDGGVTWRTNPGRASLFDGQITDVVIGYEEPVIHQLGSSEARALDELRVILPPPPFNAERVYIGVHNDGVYRSTTAGEQFLGTPAFTRLDGPDQLPSGVDAGWTKLAIGTRGTHRSGFLAAKLGPDGSRIFTTADGGTTWTEKASGVATVGYDEWCSVIAVDPTDENVLYAGAAGTLKRTTNGGANAGDWTSINAGIHADQQDIAFDPIDPRRIFLANDGGVFRSTDRGTTWTLASGGLAITQLYDIDVAEQDRDVVAGGAQDNGIYYRNASGVWRNIPWGDGTQVAIDPSDPDIFYFSSQNGLPSWLRRSIDGGASHQGLGQSGLSGGSPWITIIKLDPRDPLANPASNRVVFVCGTNELFRSTNGGQTWQRVEDGAGNPFQSAGEITALEFAPSDPSILYLATSSGAVYRATNGGAGAADWARIDTPGSPADALFPASRVQAIRVHPGNANHVWLVFGGSGVSFTGRPDMILNPLGISHLFRNPNATDAGGWVDASGRFPALSLPDVPTSAAALADFDPLVAYAGTDVGVFRTIDGGVTWTAFQDGLPHSPVAELRFNRRFNRLFAGTMGRGVYVRDV